MSIRVVNLKNYPFVRSLFNLNALAIFKSE
jgi:hypothetical protein